MAYVTKIEFISFDKSGHVFIKFLLIVIPGSSGQY